MPEVDDSNYTSIIPTAYLSAYPRIYTTTPYWPEIFQELEKLLAEQHLPPVGEESKIVRLAPELEARYVLIDKLLQQSGATQILELAAGLSPRGLLMAQSPSVSFVELDLPEMARMKQAILSRITEAVPINLTVVPGNALRLSDLETAVSRFDTARPLAVTHEGLLRYLNFDEKAQVAKNIKALLEQFGGVWITCDVTPKKFLAVQDKTTSPGFNQTFIAKTGKNFYDNMFQDEAHVTKFFGELGFTVEFHTFGKVLDELASPKRLGLGERETKELIGSGVVAVMRLVATTGRQN